MIKYISFWNVYLGVIYYNLFMSSYTDNLLPVLYITFLFTTLGILLLSNTILNNIKEVHILALFILFFIVMPIWLDKNSYDLDSYILLLLIELLICIVFFMPLIFIYLVLEDIKKRFNNIKSSIIFLNLYFISSILVFFLENIIYKILFVIFFAFLILMLSIFFERDKIFKYVIIVLLANITFIMFPRLAYIPVYLQPFIKENFYLYTIASIMFIAYILTLLDIVVGKFFTKLNDYATKLIGISAIGYSIFIIVYQLTSK